MTPKTRFFADHSFWNTTLPQDAPTHPKSAHWISLLQGLSKPGFWLNANTWSIPVYEVTPDTPRRHIAQRVVQPNETYLPHTGFRHDRDFINPMPLPDHALPAKGTDCHLSAVCRETGQAWDLWGARIAEDGTVSAFAAISYPLDGTGSFEDRQWPVQDGESIHCHGPCRHAAVPAIGGLVMHHEIRAGEIAHKLAFATQFNAFKGHIRPAMWGDGIVPGGLPEGAVIQLDPSFDVEAAKLSPAVRVIARAMQRYGMVNVDFCGGAAVYAEALPHDDPRTWTGLLQEHELLTIPFGAFRVLDTGPTIPYGFDIKEAERHRALLLDL